MNCPIIRQSIQVEPFAPEVSKSLPQPFVEAALNAPFGVPFSNQNGDSFPSPLLLNAQRVKDGAIRYR